MSDRRCIHGVDTSEECPECGFAFTADPPSPLTCPTCGIAIRPAGKREGGGDRYEPAPDAGLRAAILAIPTPKRYENDANGNWFTTDMEYGWDCAIEAAAALVAEPSDAE